LKLHRDGVGDEDQTDLARFQAGLHLLPERLGVAALLKQRTQRLIGVDPAGKGVGLEL
jgi:hypothetical protein